MKKIELTFTESNKLFSHTKKDSVLLGQEALESLYRRVIKVDAKWNCETLEWWPFHMPYHTTKAK
jgi:hypothetical protein